MSFDWKHFFHVAYDLTTSTVSGPQLEEAYRRTAVGRYYYSAFGVCYSYVKSHLRKPTSAVAKSGEKHGWVIQELQQSGDNNLVGVSQQLKTLRNYRNIADYEDVLEVNIAGKKMTLPPYRLAELSYYRALQILTALGVSV